ncbi:MAG: peptidase M48 [Polaromonas sp. 28-63-22]|nr:MAG: peptidase M48 [Polaromonas sp. 28-63-22]
MPALPTGAPAGTLPSLGDGNELATAAERRIGDRIAASIYRDPDLVDDPMLSDYIDGIWQSLRAAARARGELNAELDERFAWEVFLIRDRSVNAFALPGGYFGVHLGLIGTVSSADELAAVLAHEMSHVTQRHISRLMTQQSRQAPWMIAAMILGAIAAGKNANVGNAAIVGGQALAMQSQLNFSRDMEREADRVGYSVMQGAGYDSRGVASMFEKLQQASRLNDSGGFPYLRTHPLTTERIAEAQSRMQLSGNDPARVGGPGSALAHSPMLHAAARKLLAQLKPLAAGNAHTASVVNLLSIDIDLLAGVVPASAATFDMASARSRAEVLTEARALLAARRAPEVSSRLQTWVAAHPKDATAWQLLAVAWGNQGQSVRAIRADAESRAAQLDYGAAVDRLKAAQAMIRSNPASADYVESSIIDTRTRQMESLVKEQALQDKIDRKL